MTKKKPKIYKVAECSDKIWRNVAVQTSNDQKLEGNLHLNLDNDGFRLSLTGPGDEILLVGQVEVDTLCELLGQKGLLL